MKYKVGETVRVRSWESMEREYGIDHEGDIFMVPRFYERMSGFCGRTFVIREIFQHSGVYASDCFRPFAFTDAMLEPKFTAGDIVECVDSSGAKGIIYGRRYTVKSAKSDYIIINEHPDVEFYSSRFKLIRRDYKEYKVGETVIMPSGRKPTQKFYMIYCGSLSHGRHSTFKIAQEEAKLISKKHPGSKVLILETIDCFLCSVGEPESVELEEL